MHRAVLQALTNHFLGGKLESIFNQLVLVNWRLDYFLSHFTGPSAQDEQKTIRRH
jgi:hypothetical protein